MDWKLELIVVPTVDLDRAKDFYIENAGFKLLVDHSAGEDFRVIQLQPPGSACAIALMKNSERAGSLQGLHLVVTNIDTAHAEITARGTEASELLHFDDGRQVLGADPAHGDYNTFFTFSDRDGNGWMVQEVGRRD